MLAPPAIFAWLQQVNPALDSFLHSAFDAFPSYILTVMAVIQKAGGMLRPSQQQIFAILAVIIMILI